MNPRTEIWSWILEHLARPDREDALNDIAARVRAEQDALLAAPPTLATENNRDWVGGIRGAGHPQAFFLPWRAGAETGAHAHPNRMLVMVLRGELEITNYSPGASEVINRLSFRSGEHVIGVSDDPGYENFPHAIKAVRDSLSFHLYGDDPALGKRYPEA